MATGKEIYEWMCGRDSATWADAGDKFGLHKEAARKRARGYYSPKNLPPPSRARAQREEENAPPDPEEIGTVEFRIDGEQATATAVGKRIKSLEQLLETIKRNGGDLDPWRVARHIVNVWETGRKNKVVDLEWVDGAATGFVHDTGGWTNKANWQVKAWFEPREEYPYEKALDRLLKQIADHAPRYDPPPPLHPKGNYLAVINMYDAHFGKRSYNSGYSLENAATDFVKIAESMAARLVSEGRDIGRILFPVGHDFLHVDTVLETTSRGTWLETSAAYEEMVDAGCWALPQAIETLSTIAPVDVWGVRGNHDRGQTKWYVNYVKAFFRHHPHINVRQQLEERQYYPWGRNLLGLTHKPEKPERLAGAMPHEARELWGNAKWQEFLVGHLHKRQDAYWPVNEVSGVTIRTIPALCDTDTYHQLHVYVGNHRAADALFYHAESGPGGWFPVFVDEL